MATRKKVEPYIDDDGEVRELDDHFFATAVRGRPPLPEEKRKQRVTMMLDPDVLSKLRADGKGWQTRANALLREALGL
ncbi:BrnA antitoxin family protein [Ruegeria sp. HKCCD8929]|uniref:BrnA antitoxin family protein n=1 Tax=Ruegeria sp. HKCCD8929 TaxID=2683006 RepID=UPI001487A1F2|nr:BrnA antitoxin family protein [Ruegeria sp. HKCCD8929]